MKVGGRDFTETQDSIERAMAGVDPDSLQKHAVEINGQNFPPKQVLATVTGWPRTSFTTMEAQRVLRKLGFPLFDISVLQTGRRQFAPVDTASFEAQDDPRSESQRIAALEAALATAQEAIAGLAARVRAIEG